MQFGDMILVATIAILYNVLVHQFISITYRDLQYTEKHQNTIVMIIAFGMLGVAVHYFMNNYKKFKKYRNSNLSTGFLYGGILLLVTVIFANWEVVASEMKMIFVLAMFVGVIWYCYYREKNST